MAGKTRRQFRRLGDEDTLRLGPHPSTAALRARSLLVTWRWKAGVTVKAGSVEGAESRAVRLDISSQ